MTTSVFTVKDYRQFMRERIESSPERWGLITKMAEAAQCQRAQLSRVLSGHLQLTLDQAYGLCEFWQLTDVEMDYFLKLVEYARAGQKRYREKLGRELAALRKNQEDLAHRLKQPALQKQETESIYYSSWYWTAIHIAVSISKFQTVQKISERLALPSALVEDCLKTLERLGLVAQSRGLWNFNLHSTHLPKKSPFSSLHHSNWRQRAVLSSQDPQEDGVHYTVVQSVSEADYLKIKQLLLRAIDDYAKIAGPSKEEELACFTCDWFRV